MKLGLIISAAIVVLFGGLLFYSMQGKLDEPTQRTAPDKLVAVTLPADPPALQVAEPTGGDAAALYEQAFQFYRAHEAELSQSPPPADPVESLLGLLDAAARMAAVEAGFLDRSIPVAMGVAPVFGDALESICLLALQEADRRAEAQDMRGAVGIATSVWSLGRRAFEHNVRLYNRIQGLQMMDEALVRLMVWAEPAGLSTEGFDALAAALPEIQAAWEPKLRIVAGTDPPIGDLLNLARHDQDRTFRVAAMLRLGVARFNPGSRANLRAINAAIEDGQLDDDELVAAAADWSAALTLDEMKRLR